MSRKCADGRQRKKIHEDLAHIRRLAFAVSELSEVNVVIIKNGNEYHFFEAGKQEEGEVVEFILFQKNN